MAGADMHQRGWALRLARACLEGDADRHGRREDDTPCCVCRHWRSLVQEVRSLFTVLSECHRGRAGPASDVWWSWYVCVHAYVLRGGGRWVREVGVGHIVGVAWGSLRSWVRVLRKLDEWDRSRAAVCSASAEKSDSDKESKKGQENRFFLQRH